MASSPHRSMTGASQRLGIAAQNIEKDFWVCWTLDAPFNHLTAGGPRLLFKCGTSLSTAVSLISHISGIHPSRSEEPIKGVLQIRRISEAG